MTLRPLMIVLALGLLPAAAGAEIALAPKPLQAEVAIGKAQALADVLMMDEIVAVMREEGLDYGATLETEMFPGRGGEAWLAKVGLIYNPETMRKQFDQALAKELAGKEASVDQMIAFFGSDQGQRALRLEVEARRALLDQATEDAAKVAWEDLQANGDARVEKIERFAEINDLIESNVMGALNSNLAFYRGLAEAGAFSGEMTEDQMLSDIWGQEPEIRSETADWLFPFLALAYGPMPEDDLDAYIAFSETPAGQQVNAALFAAFDQVFTRISFDLGRAVAKQMQGEDI